MPAARGPRRTTTKAVNPDLVPIDSEVETWRNNIAGLVVITRVGEYGRQESVIVTGGRTFQITPQERRINQNAAASADLDVFTNGMLTPVTLIDGEPDTEALKANPNTLTESELPALFALRGEAFVERVEQITSTAPIARLLELARDPNIDASLAQYEALKAREAKLNNTFDPTVAAPATTGPLDGLPRGVTPR